MLMINILQEKESKISFSINLSQWHSVGGVREAVASGTKFLGGQKNKVEKICRKLEFITTKEEAQ